MEKLQIALEKARQKRTTTGSSTPRTPAAEVRPSRRAAQMGEVDAAWAALSPLEVQPATLARSRIVSLGLSSDALHFDILRTKILLQMRKNGWSRLAITSPASGCGKTTTACNLAAGLSRNSELRTVLFDLDLRRPNVAALFGQTPPHPITALLDDEVTLSDQALRLGDNMALCMAGRPVRDPTTVLLSDRTAATIDAVEAELRPDLMIFDLPPILVTDDTRAFLKNVDCALMVVQAEVTTMAEIDLCEKEMAEYTNILGIVLNQCRHVDDGYGAYEYAAG